MKKIHRLPDAQPLPTGWGAGAGEVRMAASVALRATGLACGHAATYRARTTYIAVTHNDALVTCDKCRAAS